MKFGEAADEMVWLQPTRLFFSQLSGTTGLSDFLINKNN